MPVRLVSIIAASRPRPCRASATRFVTPARADHDVDLAERRCRHASRSRSSEAMSPTSAGIANVRRPARSISVRDLLDQRSARRPVATTSAPASASPSASARPMPLVPPTTTAVRPVRSKRTSVLTPVGAPGRGAALDRSRWRGGRSRRRRRLLRLIAGWPGAGASCIARAARVSPSRARIAW